MFRKLIFFTILPAFILSGSEIVHTYYVKISSDFKKLLVSANFAKTIPDKLVAASSEAAEYTSRVRFITSGDTTHIEPWDYRMFTGNLENGTLNYEVDLEKSRRNRSWGGVRFLGDDLLLPTKLWLWRPEKLSKNEFIEIIFDVPDDMSISVPWKNVSARRYRMKQSPFDWPATLAFGSFEIDTIKVPGAQLAVAHINNDNRIKQNEMNQWIKHAAESVCQIYGKYPAGNLQILLIPSLRRSSQAVPFAQVVRGGGTAVHFFIDLTHPLKDFISDWTATHELSHPVLPFVDRDDAWLSEGMATYYQYILMARDGRLSELDAWQRIYNGFEKGKRNDKGRTLVYSSQNMSRYSAYRFVYWSGAAILLQADIELRKRGQSLDTILKKVSDYCLPELRTWTAKQLIQKMDEFSNSSVFSDLQKKYLHKKGFPIDEDFLNQLGVIIKNKNVFLSDSAPLSNIRKQIIN